MQPVHGSPDDGNSSLWGRNELGTALMRGSRDQEGGRERGRNGWIEGGRRQREWEGEEASVVAVSVSEVVRTHLLSGFH